MNKIYLFLSIIFLFHITIYSQNGKGEITGYIIDKASKEPLPLVNIIIEGTNIGAATDLEGKFKIKNVIPGKYRLKASAIGYTTQIKTNIVVNSVRPTFVTFELSASVVELDKITVSAGYFYKAPTDISSITTFGYEEIRRIPGGFEDVLRSLTLVAGVAQVSNGRNDLIVRGGAPSENLYLIDGFMIPNINHFGGQGVTGGSLSFINLDFVNETIFSTGGFPANYGNKISSVLDIKLREGRKDRLGGKATISASQFGLNLEGPFSEKSNFIFSLRRSYLDFIFNAAGFSFVPEYWDCLTKVSYKTDVNNTFAFFFIGALDRVNFNNDDKEKIYENANILGTEENQYTMGFSYTHLMKNSFLNVSLSRNYINFDSQQNDTLMRYIYLNKSTEIENKLKVDFTYKLSPNSGIDIGSSAKLINVDADIIMPPYRSTFGEVFPAKNIDKKENFYKFSFYTQYNNFIKNKIKLNLGGRFDYFDGISKSSSFSPRLSMAYIIDEITDINFSTGVYSQYPSYIWLIGNPNNKNLKPIKVNQFVLGIERQLRYDLKMKVEGFYKNYKSYPASEVRKYLVLANTGAGFSGNQENFASLGLEPLISKGKGKVYGVEISFQKKASDLPYYGIMSFTYSKALFTSIDGVERSGQYDHPITFNLAGGYIIKNMWEFSFKFQYSTGSLYTPFNIDGSQSIRNYNTERFTPTHSLNLRVDRYWNFEKLNLIVYIDIQNVYNKKNQYQIRWDYYKREVKKASSIGILPSIGISLEF